MTRRWRVAGEGMVGTGRTARLVAGAATGALMFSAAMAAAPTAALEPQVPEGPTARLGALALIPWHVAPSLATLRDEVNARWPGRDRSSDGAVGDIRHQARTNSHNPVGGGGGPAVGTRGSVHAIDLTARGIDVDLVLRSVIGDQRVWYVIYGGRIWSRTFGWAPQAYTGDPHTTHIHVNLREDSQAAAVAAESDTSRWLTGGGSASRGSAAGVSRIAPAAGAPGLARSATVALQRALIARGFGIPSGPTGWYGPETTKAVRAFQAAQGWSGAAADGIAGPLTLQRLGVTGAAAGISATPARATKPTATRPTTKARAGAYTPGTANREVYFLQQALIKAGYPIPAGATGYFGVRTVDAVKAFQRAQGWPADQCDGIPGPRTLARLGLA